MKKKIDFKIIIIVILIIILIGIIYLYTSDFTFEASETSETDSTTTVLTAEAEKMTISNTISDSGEITSALTENIELHATYYLSEILVEENEQIQVGENILKYTNGTYLVAPYNCVITKLNIPNISEKCENSHYITISSTDTLNMTISIDEDEINKISIGQEAQIETNVNSDNNYTGYVTNISNTGSNGKFEVQVKFLNDGNIKIGMSGTCEVILEKAVDAIVVPSEAVTTTQGKTYVQFIQNDGNTTQIEVEIGISNDAYTQIKSGISQGDKVQYEKQESTTNFGNMMRGNGQEKFNSQSGGEFMQNQRGGTQIEGTPPEKPTN